MENPLGLSYFLTSYFIFDTVLYFLVKISILNLHSYLSIVMVCLNNLQN